MAIMTMKSLTRFRKLRWSTPVASLPHGWLGILVVITGGILNGRTVFSSSLDLYQGPLPYVYSAALFGNAVAGYRLSSKAPGFAQLGFRACAIFQMCLAYYVMRFLPSFPSLVPSLARRCMDIVLVFPLLSIGFSFIDIAAQERAKNPEIAMAILVGTFGISLTFCYPLQLAWQSNWLECVVEQRYPFQDIAMAAYIYLPASYCFALILFGSTLYLRNIISDTQFGVGAGTVVVLILLLTVMLQEIHLPGVSAQELYMSCPLAETSSWQFRLETATSPRPVLDYVLELSVVKSAIRALGAHKLSMATMDPTS